MVRPSLCHGSTFETSSLQAFPHGRQFQGKTHVKSIGMRIKPTKTPCGTNPANGRSVIESNHPRTAINRMTIGIHDLRRAVAGDGFSSASRQVPASSVTDSRQTSALRLPLKVNSMCNSSIQRISRRFSALVWRGA